MAERTEKEKRKMADGDMTSFLASGSPLAPLQTEAWQGQQLSQLPANPGTTGWGVLGNLIGEVRGQSMLQDAQSRMAQAYQQAMPSLSRAYASPNPYQTLANDPNADPIAKWMMFSQSPEAVARAQQGFAGAAETQALVPRTRAITERVVGSMQQPYDPTTGLPVDTGMPQAAPGTAKPPADTSAAANPEDSLGQAIRTYALLPPGPSRTAYLRGLPVNIQRLLIARAQPVATGGGPQGGRSA